MRMPPAPIRFLPTATVLVAWTLTLWATPAVAAAPSASWPQFRGPARDGTTPSTPIARQWHAETNPRERWRRPIGSGFSAIAVSGGRLFTMAADGAHEVALALDPATGETLWQTPVGALFENSFGHGPRATPTVDGDTVYVVSADAQLKALTTKDGTVRWHRDLADLFDGGVPRFGYSASPLVDGDRLIVEVGGAEAGDESSDESSDEAGAGQEKSTTKAAVASLDKHTGAVRWSALNGQAGYSSPVVVDIGGIRQYVFLRRHGPEAISLAADDGRVLWRRPGARAGIATPLFVPPDRFFLSSSDDDFGGVMVRVQATPVADGAIPTLNVEDVWTQPRMRNHFNGSVVVGQHLYGFDNATFRCLDLATGEPAWAHRGFGKGSLVAVGDQLLVLGDDGALALVDATPEAYRERGRIQAMEGKAWTMPSVAGGAIYLRDLDEMVAYDLRAAASGDAP